MKTGKKKIFQKIKLMVPLALMSVTLGACSLTSQSSTSASASATTTQTATSTTKTDTSSYFTAPQPRHPVTERAFLGPQ